MHWNIEDPDSPFAIEPEALWKTSRPGRIANTKVFQLSPEDLLIHCCLHTAFRHHFNIGLRALVDIAEIVAHFGDELDWQHVAYRARQWQVERCVALVLYFAHELLAVDRPPQYFEELAELKILPELLHWVRERILMEGATAPSMNQNLVRMWRTRRIRDKMTIFLKRMFPSPRIIAQAYAAVLSKASEKFIGTLWGLNMETIPR